MTLFNAEMKARGVDLVQEMCSNTQFLYHVRRIKGFKGTKGRGVEQVQRIWRGAQMDDTVIYLEK